MTDFHGIGAVSATLRALLKDRAELPTGSGDVLFTVGPPRTEAVDGTAEKARVNLFLYRVTENGSLKNQELSGQASSNGYGHPPLSVDLHYLLTAYGSTAVDEDFVDETRAHHLLGSAMRVLHDYPVVTDDLVTVRTPTGQPILDAALLSEFERVKLSLDQISLEDLSKVWTALTLPYRASAAYKITVVQIESRRPRRSAQLVGEPPDAGPRVAALPMRRPRIHGLAVRRPTDPPDRERPQAYVRIGDTLVIRGSSLGGERTHVFIGSFDATAAVVSAVEDRLAVLLPDDLALQPGGLPVQIRVEAPGLAKPIEGSNVALVSLVPRVDGVEFKTGPKRFIVTGARLFSPDNASVAILGDRVVASADYTTSKPEEIVFRLPKGVTAGPYSLRVRVNGAESIDNRTVAVT